MKAVVYRQYGPPDVLKIEEVEKPVPGSREILVRVQATTVRAGDWRMRSANPFLARFFNGLFKPGKINVLGMELSGIVEAVGINVTKFEIGENIFATTGLKFGAHAEYCCLPEDGIAAVMPGNCSFEEAASFPSGGLAALSLLAKGNICCGRNVLVFGTSGGVGSLALQIAKYYGAEVTAICRTDHIEFVKSLGADKVIDYTREDFSNCSEKFDLVCDCAGKMLTGIGGSGFKKLLKENGKYISIEKSYKEKVQDLVFLKELIEAGRIKPVIDRIYKLEEIREAHEYAEKGHKKGNVVITIEE